MPNSFQHWRGVRSLAALPAPTKQHLPAFLAAYANRRVLAVLVLGFASGLPFNLTGATLSAWLAESGVDIRVIGLFAVLGVPYTVKPLYAWVFDRWRMPFLDRRRGWLAVIQLAGAVSLAAIGLTSPALPLVIGGLALVAAFCSACQDIVIDAYRADVLGERERGAGAAAGVAGYRVAMLTSGGFALMLADHLPWAVVYALMAALMASCTLVTLWAPGAPEAAPAASSWEAVIEPLREFFARPVAYAVLAFIVLFKLPDALIAQMIMPSLIGLGFTKTAIGVLQQGLGMGATLAGTAIGGALYAQLGTARTLWLSVFVQALPNVGYGVLAWMGPSAWGLAAVVGIDNVANGVGNAAFVAFMMSLCDPRYSASQYALLSSAMALSRVIAGVFSGFLAAELGFAWFFPASLIFMAPAIALLPRFAPWGAPSPRA